MIRDKSKVMETEIKIRIRIKIRTSIRMAHTSTIKNMSPYEYR